MKRRTTVWVLAVLAWAWLGWGAAREASARPVISHDPVRVAVKGQPLGLRAVVRDAGGRVTAVSVYYAASRGMTPFRMDMNTAGAGIWYGSIPGHLIGPGDELLYYVHAENSEGEGADTGWTTVKVVEDGVGADEMPSASEVAQSAQRAAAAGAGSGSGAAAAGTSKPAEQKPAAKEGGSKRYWVPVAIVAGGAAAIGGGIALASSGGGGGHGGGSGSGGGTVVTNANFGGSYSLSFKPSTEGAVPVEDSGLVNVYVKDGRVQIAGLWGGEVLETAQNGSTFTAVGDVAARGDMPAAHLIVTGETGSSRCSGRVDGYSLDPAAPGDFGGTFETTKR